MLASALHGNGAERGCGPGLGRGVASASAATSAIPALSASAQLKQISRANDDGLLGRHVSVGWPCTLLLAVRWRRRCLRSEPRSSRARVACRSGRDQLKELLLGEHGAHTESADSACPHWATLLETFGRLDKNGDGLLSKDEVREALKSKISDEEVEETLTALDAFDMDKDGKINYAEFMQMLR
eukprot:TRINITY_DN5299_c0_g2_i1.p1 TRINITY_DN5299_c0_g2~~TRINITY_DN5299_c0_g2_i1.p1  ORF type:complete len:184 (-),score=30.39 TRINITY_DN5299_c0_g2_i1:141-692(-)